MTSRRGRRLLFGKVPLPGAVKTRLCPPLTPSEAAELYTAFLHDILGAAQREADRVETIFAVWPDPMGLSQDLREPYPAIRFVDQVGQDLPARMEHALRREFAVDASPILLRNTDSPCLDEDLTARAFEAFDDGAELVVGPDRGGGYYLIGVSQQALAVLGDLLSVLRDGPLDAVFARTMQRARRLGLKTFVLPVQDDVDQPEDLARLRRQVEDDPLIAPATRRVIDELVRRGSL